MSDYDDYENGYSDYGSNEENNIAEPEEVKQNAQEQQII